MKKILVTGGAGFIGSHLCRRLLNDGNKVICLDNFYTGNKNNIVDLKQNSNFEVIEQDIIEYNHICVDEIYNLACPASPVQYQKDPIYTIKTSVLGAINMLKLAQKLHIKILQASTSEVYGDPHVYPQHEQYYGNVNPIGERSCYDESKRCVESLFVNYGKQTNADTKIVRIFNTYGPQLQFNDGRVISNFILQALQGKDITIYGNGEQTRSFCYIDDMVDGLVKMMNSSFAGPINLGNPEEITIIYLANLIITLIESKSIVKYIPISNDDPKRRCPDISLAKNLLGWEPKVSLKEGLVETIKYFRNA